MSDFIYVVGDVYKTRCGGRRVVTVTAPLMKDGDCMTSELYNGEHVAMTVEHHNSKGIAGSYKASDLIEKVEQ